MLSPKVSIIGAGNVGMRYAYSLMISGLSRSIVIVDLDHRRVEGEVMDLASGMPYISPVELTSGDYPDMQGSNLVVITAGRKQQPDQSRLDLAKDNVAVFQDIIPKVVKHAPEAIILVVTNPVDVLSYAAYKISGKDPAQIIGSGTVLDSYRLRFLLSQHCNIDSRNIHGYILGEHGDSEFPVWSRAMIGGVLFSEYCPTCRMKCDRGVIFNRLFEEVQSFASKVIEKKGETSYGIGLALVKISEAILKDENSILPVSCLADGYYDIKDVYLSLPSVLNKSGVRQTLALKLSEDEVISLKKSSEILKTVIKKAGL